jgi:thiosulfate/3-mercaptopyruvate sulfurtransferase
MPMMLLIVQLAVTAEPVKLPLLAEPAEMAKSTALVIDVRNAAPFQEGHFPGAINVRTTAWSKAVVDGKADAAFWAAELAKIGLAPGRTVIVCGDDMREVCRGWWLLRYAGVADVRVFNGPVKLFADAGGTLAKGESILTPVKPSAWTPVLAHHVHLDNVLSRSAGNETGIVIDGRSPEEFKDGRVPKAKHLEWLETLDAKTGKFKSTDELKKLFERRGIDVSESPMCYCQSGGRASVVAFAVEIVSGKPAKNYYRSWSEWGSDPSTPKEK